MKSSFFYGDYCDQTAAKIKTMINAEPDFLSERAVTSPRAVGDTVQSLISDRFEPIIGTWCTEWV